ncbi:MAG: F0F1 ATP synthase subunit delta, partial [Bifidobacteriaceae bacterium]|nr:F0F1 ATP synthase subunit delta [Bifidobacteriaceae bacterium]
MLLGGSAASLVQAKNELSRALTEECGRADRLAEELFALTDALDSDPALARALTNPNRSAAAKRRLVHQVMAGHQPVAGEL